jgi:hypothetical protein
MEVFITIYLAYVCNNFGCYQEHLVITSEAMAIATCESGDTTNYGTYNFTARSKTQDGGAWQFHDSTYNWMNGYANAENDTPMNQYNSFVRLWDDGAGWRHWAPSKPCWDKWIVIDNKDKAIMK